MSSSSQLLGDVSNKQPEEEMISDDDNKAAQDGDEEQTNHKAKDAAKEIEEKTRKRKSEVWLEFERNTEKTNDGTIRKYENCKMNFRIKVDIITVLPNNVIDSILTRLPIKEAVRTSILSRSWRYQWHSLSKISMKLDNLLPHSKVVEIIDNVFLVHRGSVDKFELYNINLTPNDMDRWIFYLSRNGIKELIINNQADKLYNFPSCIYSCSDLRHLILSTCILKPPPAAFKAFINLKLLCFLRVEIASTMLEILVNSCPQLRVLALARIYHCPSLKINAPNLLYFSIKEFYCYFQLKNTPCLEHAYFELRSSVSSHNADSNDCKIVELLGSMPLLRRLEFHEFALQHLAVGDVPARLPSTCSIKHLIMCVNFEDLQELLAAFCIFRSAPFIHQLELRVFGDKNTSRISADGFWEGKQDFNFRFDHLQNVKVTSFTGNGTELKFIEFVLGSAPVLKTMEIQFSVDKNAEDLFCMVTKLVELRRISPDAELILPKYE